MKNTIFYGNAVALNCNLTNLADGTTLAVQLSPFGEFALHDGGKMNGTVQHCTRAAFEAMVANWKAAGSPEILVDVDHNSATGRSTEADAAEAAANAEAEKFADDAVKCGKVAANAKAAVKAAYRQSPEVAKQMLNALAAPARAPLPDFSAGKTPAALNAAAPGAAERRMPREGSRSLLHARHARKGHTEIRQE